MFHLNLDFTLESQLFENLKEKIESGLSLADIENALFFIVSIRFVILSIRYNLKTSFLVSCGYPSKLSISGSGETFKLIDLT